MNAEPPAPPVPQIVKPLLLEALGMPFLAYILGASEDEIEEWLVGTSEEFGTPQQTQAIVQLHFLLQRAQGDDQPGLRRLNLAHILGTYHESLGNTLANSIRTIATNDTPTPLEDESLEEILAQLVRTAYPRYLLPDDPDSFAFQSFTSASLFQHPLRARFDSAVTDDDLLAKLFPDENENSDRIATVVRSTGQSGSVTRSTFAETVIDAGWRAARMASVECPSPDEHIKATLAQIDIIRLAMAGKRVQVPVRIAFTGVRLVSDHPLDLGWGVLRMVDDRDGHLVPRSIEGQLTGTGVDGISVTIDYSGDVVLDTPLEYRIIRKERGLGEAGWPQELRGYELIERLIESVQLGALLSQSYNPSEPITVLSTWRSLHDPLSYGYNTGWRDPRMSRGFMPKKLDKAEAEKWRESAVAVEKYRTKNIDIAIRRTLRAAAERQDPTDVLVDAVIAWENLVGSRRGEPTLRVSGSLAWLLERDNLAKRAALRGELVKLYQLRSDVVHGNKLPPLEEFVPKSQRALEVAVAALRVLFTTRLDLLREYGSGDDRSNRLLMGG